MDLSWTVPSWDELLISITACALAAYTVTWLARAVIPSSVRFRCSLLRLIAVLVGVCAGVMVMGSTWGAVIGLGSGGLTTTVVAFLKARLKAKQAE